MPETNFEKINYVYPFLDRNTVFRINWKHILAFVPITFNDGTIYLNFGKKMYFSDTDLQYWYNNGSKIAPPKSVPSRCPILLNNIANCGMKRYALESQRYQLFNASKISSQLALEASIKAHL